MKLIGSFLAFFASIIFLFLLFLLELILLKDLPELAKFRLILKGSSGDLLEVVATRHSPLVVWAQLSIEHHLSYFYVAKRFLTST
jgi:hypothetical protein